MAWTGIDDFDSYTTGADLNTLNGGSGWGGAWTDAGGSTMTIETAPAGGQGGKAVRSQSAVVDTHYTRAIANTTVGTLGFRMRLSITNPNDSCGVNLTGDGGAVKGAVRFGPTSNIEIYDNSLPGWVTIAAYAADTWYTIEIDWNDGTNADAYRARVNGGTYSGYKNVIGGGYDNIDGMWISDDATNAHVFWLDDIGLAGATGPAPETRTITMVRGG